MWWLPRDVLALLKPRQCTKNISGYRWPHRRTRASAWAAQCHLAGLWQRGWKTLLYWCHPGCNKVHNPHFSLSLLFCIGLSWYFREQTIGIKGRLLIKQPFLRHLGVQTWMAVAWRLWLARGWRPQMDWLWTGWPGICIGLTLDATQLRWLVWMEQVAKSWSTIVWMNPELSQCSQAKGERPNFCFENQTAKYYFKHFSFGVFSAALLSDIICIRISFHFCCAFFPPFLCAKES